MYKNKKIAVVIPAYNEETQIGTVIGNIPDYVDYIIVINDGSTDKTEIIARGKGAIVVNHNRNKGVGAAFNTGLSKVLELKADIMVNIDADGQFNPKDIEKLVQPIVAEQAEFVTASRFKDPHYYPKMSRVKFIGNKLMSLFISALSGDKFYDVSCGFRAFSKEALLRLNLFGEYTYTQETFLILAYNDLPIAEVPVEVRGSRKYGKSKVASNLFKYGYKTFKIILRTFRDYKPFSLFLFLSLAGMSGGFVFGLFLLIHYINTGRFTPHKWAGFVSGFLFVLSLVFLGIGFVLDIFANIRKNQERTLYFIKRKYYGD